MAGGKTSSKPSLPSRADFEEIEAAVMETARGRWFLAEYARRHRATDTAAVLEALARLEARLTANLEGPRTEPIAAVATPEPEPEPEPSPPPMARADDLKAMAEELLRGSRLFDWVGTSELETQEQQEPDPLPDAWKPAPLAPAHATAPQEEQEASVEEPPDDDPEIEDDEIAAWEAELVERALPPAPARTAPPPLPLRAPPPAPPIVRSAPPPLPPRPQINAFADLPEIAPRHAERASLVERLTDLRQPFSAVPQRPANEPKPLPTGPRVDDPTLTMTRDEKLALFS